MLDQIPITWADGVTLVNDVNFNTEITAAAMLMLNPPTCSVHRAASMTVPTGWLTWTPVSWDTLNFDTEAPADPIYSAGSPTMLTVQTSGWYECIASAELFTTPGLLTMMASFRVNGSAIYQGSSVYASSGNLDMNCSNLIALNANDYIELVFTHSYGSALTIDQRGFQPVMTISRRRGI